MTTLRLGTAGKAVSALQHDLQSLKLFKHSVTGYFGAITRGAVKQFEKSHHLHVDGFVDAGERARIHAAAVAAHRPPAPHPAPHHPAPHHPAPHPAPHHPAPVGLSRVPHGEAAQYAFFKSFVPARGGKFLTGPNQINLVGMRKDNRVGAGGGQYHDALYAVWSDAAGKKHVQRFRYTTEPAQNMRYDGSDVNHDGTKDLGRVPAGFYKYAVSQRSNGAHCLRPVSAFTSERDINHDGSFSEHYRRSSGADMLFHQGGNSSTGSAGCQTLPPSEFTRFWNTVRHARGAIGYTLTTQVPSNA